MNSEEKIMVEFSLVLSSKFYAWSFVFPHYELNKRGSENDGKSHFISHQKKISLVENC